MVILETRPCRLRVREEEYILLDVVSNIGASQRTISVQRSRKGRVHGTERHWALLLGGSISDVTLGSLCEGFTGL